MLTSLAPIRSGRHTSEADEDSLDSLDSPPPYSPSRRPRHPTPASEFSEEALLERSFESRVTERGMIHEALDGNWEWNEWAVVMGDCPRGGSTFLLRRVSEGFEGHDDPASGGVYVWICRDHGSECNTLDSPSKDHIIRFFNGEEEFDRDNCRSEIASPGATASPEAASLTLS